MGGGLVAPAPVSAGRSADSTRRSADEDQWRRWIGRMVEADETALSALYDATALLVHGLVLRILSDASAAEEVTADVYMQAWRQAERYDHSRGAPSTWLLTLARSRAIDRLRRAPNHRREEPLSDQILLDRRPDPLEASACVERRNFVRSALAGLNPQQKLAIELAFFDGLSHAEVAARLGEPLGTVKTRIRLGMLKLAKMDLVAKQLVHAVDPALPPASVKARLLERVRAASAAPSPAAEKTREPAPCPRPVSQVWKNWEASPPDAMVFASAKSEDWYEVAPSIRVRPLFVDSVEKMVTMLVEMGPGTSYPPHRHSRGEECYVIAGDLTVDGQLLGAGDYQRAGGGSMHTTQSTHDGCLLLIRSSQEDELLAGR